MVKSKARSLAAVGGLVVAGAALAGCGGGSGSKQAVGSAGPTSQPVVSTSVPATTVLAPTVSATTVPVPATTAPAPTVSATTVPVPATTVPAASSSAGPVLIVKAFDGTVGYDGQKPSTIGFSRDSTNIVSHLAWTSWGAGGAVGHGSMGMNSCNPNCATGTVTQVPATVDLAKVVDGHFTAMTEEAGTLVRSFTYPSNWAATAS